MVFLAKTVSPAEWKVVSSVISTLVEEATFEANSEGIYFKAMVPSHVALVDLLWQNSAFEKYECDKPIKFSLRIDDFTKLIKRADACDSVEITMAENEKLLLRISNGYRREFMMHLIESSYGPTPLPKLSFNVKIMMVQVAFEKLLSDVSVVSDHVDIEASKDKIMFMGKGDTGSAFVTIEKNSQNILELDVKEDSKATYSLKYLLNIVKNTKSENTTLEYSSKMPIRLEFKLSNLGGRIHFYLAPRIE